MEIYFDEAAQRQRPFELLRSGLSIIPLCWPTSQGECGCGYGHVGRDIGKAPLLRPSWTEYQKRRPGPGEVREWFAKFGYEVNWGLVCGQVSGVTVLDFDSWDAYRAFCAEHGTPDTLHIRSGSGDGVHVYIKWRRGLGSRILHDKAGGKICEVRSGEVNGLGGRGMYVVAPGSMHLSGGVYAPWGARSEAGDFGDVLAGQVLVDRLTEAPDFLVDSPAATPKATVVKPAPVVQKKKVPFWVLNIFADPEAAIARSEEKRSGVIASVVGGLAGAGWTEEEVFEILVEQAWSLRDRSPAILKSDIARLMRKSEANREIREEKVIERAVASGRVRRVEADGEIGITPLVHRMADVEAEAVEWLWKPMLPRRKLCSLYGDQGEGKTFVAMDIAARLTRGDTAPDGSVMMPACNVLYMSAEDGMADTLRPRAEAAGADPQRMMFLDGVSVPEQGKRQVMLSEVALLRKVVEDNEIRLIIIDPLQGYLGAEVDMFRANETRPVMAALGDLCEQCDCTILFIGHLNKSTKDRALYRALGSIDLTAVMRSIWLAGHMPKDKDQHGLVHQKCSLAAAGKPLGYRLETVTIGKGIEVARVRWTLDAAVTAADLLAPDTPGGDGKDSEESTLERAADYLRLTLQDGPRASAEVVEGGANQGLTERTLRRALRDIGGFANKAPQFGGRWIWSLGGS